MSTNNFDEIIISFARPADAVAGYQFLKKPDDLIGGGLNEQVVIIIEKVSLADLVRDFFGASGFTAQFTGVTSGLLVAAVIAVALDLISIKSFPEEYSSLLGLVEMTPRGSALNWEEVNKLFNNSPELSESLNALVKENFLIKKRDGNYIVIKKILMRLQVDFV